MLLSTLALVAITAEPVAPARHDLAALLAKPVSPGLIALLLPHLPDEAALARVISALSHPDATVRATAARVVYVADVKGTATAVRAALDAETDRSAAVEQLRAATLTMPAGGEPALRAIAEKHALLSHLSRAMGIPAPSPSPERWRSPDEYARIMIAGGLPPGLLRDILAVTGCRPDADLRAPAIVEYRPDGRARHLTNAARFVLNECAQAATAALGLTLAPPEFLAPALPDRKSIVIVPLNEGALECADQPEPAATERVSDPGAKPTIKEPRKIKNVAPHYPAPAREARRQGAVVLEAVITESGCIRFVRIVQGVAPDLDLAAMIAVNQWRYAPTLVDGKPVTVIMTVTVNFRLR
jgi:TonB family protein